MDWQSIATAPKDGTTIMLFGARGRYKMVVGKWFPSPWCAWQSQPGSWPINPTHWMPLPTPPARP